MSADEQFPNTETARLYKEIFEDVEIWDAHAHIGMDMDGTVSAEKHVLRDMRSAKVNKAVIFALNDPRDNRHFTLPNDMVWEAYSRNPDTFIPFFRLNPWEEWRKEFRRCTEIGFKGIKLHPRSQHFRLTHPEAKKIYEKAEKDSIPVLIHTGFGLGKIAHDLIAICRKFPKLKLILGHSAFVDIDDTIRMLAGRTNVLFDTSVVRIYDLFVLLNEVDYRRIVFGSDVPYGEFGMSLSAIVDTSIYLRKSPHQIKCMLGANLRGWLS